MSDPFYDDPMLLVCEDDLMHILRCAIFCDSGLTRVNSRVWMQLSPQNKKLIEEWLQREYGEWE